MAVRAIGHAGVDQPFELPAGTNHFLPDLNLTVENTTLYPVMMRIFQEGVTWQLEVQPETRSFVSVEDITDFVHQPLRRMITVAPRPEAPRPEEIAQGVAMVREAAIQDGRPDLAEIAEERVADIVRRAFEVQRR